MKWQCALLKRWLPEYPDGDLPAWGKRWLGSHVPGCSACRQELAELRQVIAAIEATPVTDPAPEFWGEFSRDLHLKLVQAAQEGQAAPEATSSRWFRLPYLLGAPAMAALLLYVAVQLTGPGAPIQNQAVVMHPRAPPGAGPGPGKAGVRRQDGCRPPEGGGAGSRSRRRTCPADGTDGTVCHGGSGGRGAPAGGGSGYFRLGPGCGTGGNDRPGKECISQQTAST